MGVARRHSAEEYARAAFALLPRGWIWTTQTASRLWELWLATGTELARISGRAADLEAEANPATTFELVSEWERALGLPDDCRPLGSLAQRRARIIEKLTETPIITPEYLIALAASEGFTITIDEADRSTFFYAGSDAGAPLRTPILIGAITINAPATGRRPFYAGTDHAGDPLGFVVSPDRLECLLDARIHAHLHVTYSYT